MREKIVDMLATVREMRQEVAKTSISALILGVIARSASISQKDLLQQIPDISSRTARRHIALSIQQKRILAEKQGREVFYTVNPNYPQ